MQRLEESGVRRILIVDDNRAIHEDFRKILGHDESDSELADMEAALFGTPTGNAPRLRYEIDDAYQGKEALQKLAEAVEAGRPYDAAFVDMRMPPGWDGAETVWHLWQKDPDLQVVICTAFSDYTWSELVGELKPRDNLLILKKPFDNCEVLQLAAALTEKRRLARQARLRMDELERMVAERTEALRKKDEQLRHSQKMEAIGCLAGGIAHEFNNLLQAISGFTRCAMDGLEMRDPRYQDLEQVCKATQRAASLTRQLLGFSRRQVLERRTVNANDLVADVTKMVQPLIGERIELELKLGRDVGTVRADSAQIQQVLLNLCINARDAMPAGGKLLVKTERLTLGEPLGGAKLQAGPGCYVVISVVDTGCGMTPEVKQRIFEPFFTTKEVGQGTGLGLATVYGILQQHEGAIHVYSEPGQGTAFKIYLPSADQAADTSQPGANDRRYDGTETILLAEDESLVRRLAVRFLEEAGYRVLVAQDGEEALRLFRQHRDEVSLVLLDAVMPKLNGREVYQRIKAWNPQTKAVFCSGYDPETAQSGFIAEQNLRLVQKPFERANLLRTIREVLDEKETPCLDTAMAC